MSFEIDKLVNLMRSQAQGANSQFTHMRIGQVSSYDKDTYTAKILIQPEGLLTGWLPILTSWMGNGWGFYSPPEQGDTVVVHFMEGSLSSGFVGERVFTKFDVPLKTPTGVPSGEAWMVHKTGTYLKFLNDGTIEIKCLDGDGNPTNLNITAENVMVTGSIIATGDILDNSESNSHTVKDMRDIFNDHVHSGVMAGGDDSGPSTTSQ